MSDSTAIRTKAGVVKFTLGMLWWYEWPKIWQRLSELHLIATGALQPTSAQVVSRKLLVQNAASAYRTSLQCALAAQLVASPRARMAILDSLLKHVEQTNSLAGLESPFLSVSNAAGELVGDLKKRRDSAWRKLILIDKTGGNGPSTPLLSFYPTKVSFLDVSEVKVIGSRGPVSGGVPAMAPGKGPGAIRTLVEDDDENEFCDRLGDLAGNVVSGLLGEKGKGAGKSGLAGSAVDYLVDKGCAFLTAKDGPFGIKPAPEGDPNQPPPVVVPEPTRPGQPAGGTPPQPGEEQPATSTPSPGQPSGGTPLPPDGEQPPGNQPGTDNGDGGTPPPDDNDEDTDDKEDGDEEENGKTEEADLLGYIPNEETSGLTSGDINAAKRLIQSAPIDRDPDAQQPEGGHLRNRPGNVDPHENPDGGGEERDPWTIIQKMPTKPLHLNPKGMGISLGIAPYGHGTSHFVFTSADKSSYYLVGLPTIGQNGHIVDLGVVGAHPSLAKAFTEAKGTSSFPIRVFRRLEETGTNFAARIGLRWPPRS